LPAAPKKREKGKEKEQDKGETVYKINESEPSEYLRQLCLECGSAFSPSYKAEILTLETRSTEEQTVKFSAS